MLRPLCTRALLPLAFLPAVAVRAQLFAAGASQTTSSVLFTRGSAGLGAGELIQRFDADDWRGFGVDASFQGFQLVAGVLVAGRDFGSNTINGLVDVYLYAEDPTTPNFPDLATPLAHVDDVQLPPLFGAATVVFPQPGQLPVGSDVFVGVRVKPTTSSFGGARLAVVYGYALGSSYDLAGGGMPTTPPVANSYRMFRDLTTNTVVPESRGQYMIELLTVTPSGAPTAITNQVNFAGSNFPPGTTSMMSGLHPDAAAPPAHAGRVDDVAFLFGDWTMPAQSPVAFLGAFADFGPVVPLDMLVPGSLGSLCLDQAALFPLGVAPLNAGRAFLLTSIPTAVRPLLAGEAWTQQAIALDPTNGTLRGSQCGKQHF